MNPHNPSANGNGGRSEGATAETPARDYVCAAVGLLMTVAVIALLYPALVAIAHPFSYLAVTALICLLVVVWLAVWTCVEVAWTWRVGSPDP